MTTLVLELLQQRSFGPEAVSTKKEKSMRYMIILKNDPNTEQQMPSPELFKAMNNYSKTLFDAGILQAVEGLSYSAHDAQVTFAKGKHTVKDGPFTEAKELVGGFWIIRAKSRADALEWAKRMPSMEGASVEVRRVAEIDDFKDVMPPEVIAQAKELRDDLAKQRA
jgi:hypothetical protein